MDRLLTLSSEMINRNLPVWFGCDVGKERDRESGTHQLNIINYQITGLDNQLNKEQKLRNYLALPNHAMLITGYHQINNNIVKWKIENSWGEKSGSNGYLIMSNDWMKEYTFQILVKKELLSNEERNLLNQQPLTIQPWDPLGTLA